MKNVKTKQWFSLSAVVLTAMLVVSGLASCSKSETELPPDDSRVINLSASVQATTNTKAAVVGTTFPATTDNVFRLTAFSGAAAPADWSVTPYFSDIQVNSGVASALTLATAQYYPANGDKVYFYGYAPEATSLTAGTASAAPIANYTITGQEDIMAAQETTGIAAATTGTQRQPALAFTHKLMQVRFKVVKDASFETGKKVTEVLVKDVKTSAKLSIGDGALTFDGTADQTLSLPITAGTKDEITAAGTEMDNGVMCQPVGAGGLVTLKITAGGVVYDNIAVALSGTNNGLAGTSHLITLTFKRGEITPTATITDWLNTGSGSADVGVPPPAIGDFKDGGVVYWVRGGKYKVFSLDQGSYLQWTPHYDSAVMGADGQDVTDGKKNMAAIKAYFDANAATLGTDFSVAFPAAAFCEAKNTGGVTGWYLPAKDELAAFCTVYKANKSVLDKAIIDYHGTAIDTDNTAFWSSTEDDSSDSSAWWVAFYNGEISMIVMGKDDYKQVRCVREN